MITRCPLIYSHVSPIVMPCLSPPAYLAKISCYNKRDFVSEGCFLMTNNFAYNPLDSSPGFSFQMLIQPNTDQIQNTSNPIPNAKKAHLKFLRHKPPLIIVRPRITSVFILVNPLYVDSEKRIRKPVSRG